MGSGGVERGSAETCSDERDRLLWAGWRDGLTRDAGIGYVRNVEVAVGGP